MLDWIDDHKTLLWSLSAASAAVLVASFFLIPLVVARIRPDYFAHEKRPDRSWINLHPTLRIAIHIGKNILGAILMIAGLVMLALPGPGMFTLLVGFFLLDFPGKYRFERWLVARAVIHRPINWLRRRSGRLPLVILPKSAHSHEPSTRQLRSGSTTP
jgi:hypothetical protein